MPLAPPSLIADLTKIFMANNPVGAVVAQQMATAYDKYAKQAIAMTLVPCPNIAPGAMPALAAALIPAMAPAPIPGKIELAFIAGLPAYWAAALYIGPPIPPAPAPTASAPGGILLPGAAVIAMTMAVPGPSPAVTAMKLGNALHIATAAAIVSFANAPPGALM